MTPKITISNLVEAQVVDNKAAVLRNVDGVPVPNSAAVQGGFPSTRLYDEIWEDVGSTCGRLEWGRGVCRYHGQR